MRPEPHIPPPRLGWAAVAHCLPVTFVTARAREVSEVMDSQFTTSRSPSRAKEACGERQRRFLEMRNAEKAAWAAHFLFLVWGWPLWHTAYL